MKKTPWARWAPVLVTVAAALAHGAAQARSVTVSSGGGGLLPVANCGDVSLSVASGGCEGMLESTLSIERTNVVMDGFSNELGATQWTDSFSEAVTPGGRYYTPFQMFTDALLGDGAGSDNLLFDAIAGVSADGRTLQGTLTLLRALNHPFILGLSGSVVGAPVNFSGLFLYTDTALNAGDTIHFSMPNTGYTPPAESGCIDSNGLSCDPVYDLRFNAVAIFEDPASRPAAGAGAAVPAPGTLALAGLGLGLAGALRRRQRAAAMAAR